MNMDAKPSSTGSRLQLSSAVDRHARDELRPPVVLRGFSVGLVADEKHAAGCEHPPHLRKALRQIRPEVDGFKGRHRIKLRNRKRKRRNAALKHPAAPFRNCPGIQLSGFLHADRRVVDASCRSLRNSAQQLPQVRSAAAAAIQHPGVGSEMKKPEAPIRQHAVAEVHHGHHDSSSNPDRLPGVVKECPLISFPPVSPALPFLKHPGHSGVNILPCRPAFFGILSCGAEGSTDK